MCTATAPLAREIKGQYDTLNRIVDELQTAVMAVRMVPLGSVFERFRRLVRDLSRPTGQTDPVRDRGRGD